MVLKFIQTFFFPSFFVYYNHLMITSHCVPPARWLAFIKSSKFMPDNYWQCLLYRRSIWYSTDTSSASKNFIWTYSSYPVSWFQVLFLSFSQFPQRPEMLWRQPIYKMEQSPFYFKGNGYEYPQSCAHALRKGALVTVMFFQYSSNRKLCQLYSSHVRISFCRRFPFL